MTRSAYSAPPAAPVSAEKVEAVYLFNFARFVTWPTGDFATPEAPVVVGILGRDPFGAFLDEVVKDEKIERRPITIRRYANVREVDACHILYISKSEADHLDRIFAVLSDRHILTVSKIRDFAFRGGMVQFFDEQDRLRFRINLQRAKASSLELSAKLLRPAEVVFQGRAGLYAVVNAAPRRGRGWDKSRSFLCTLRAVMAGVTSRTLRSATSSASGKF